MKMGDWVGVSAQVMVNGLGVAIRGMEWGEWGKWIRKCGWARRGDDVMACYEMV